MLCNNKMTQIPLTKIWFHMGKKDINHFGTNYGVGLKRDFTKFFVQNGEWCKGWRCPQLQAISNKHLKV